ncbi:hypothetical protein DPEC_G00055330 [Dallia pectoralis]|uniref:Uncharacterized protein n=1 Tax=Dallia pectoralis TaxID=75939 RepID=A0ACC2H5E3_DALPE|nr:hypothetical protein DPEC_G00055330 [Dallia pectoralis]
MYVQSRKCSFSCCGVELHALFRCCGNSTRASDMASLLGKSLFEINGQCPAPNKDFFQFSVTKTEVIWRLWKISLRSDGRNTRPGELRESHEDFLDDSRLQSQLRVVFGPRILQYCQALCQGHYDYLERLPDPLLLYILAHLDLEDVASLGCTSHRFRKLCGSQELWEQVVRSHCNSVSAEMEALALEVGWKSVFFTSRLQLQKQISRKRQRGQQQRSKGPESHTVVQCSEGPESHTAGIEPDSQLCPGKSEHRGTLAQRTGAL